MNLFGPGLNGLMEKKYELYKPIRLYNIKHSPVTMV
jgi:hypothetical protein